MNNKQPVDYQSVESRRSSRSDRRMTPMRRLYYFLGMPVLRAITRLLTLSYRFEPVIGAANIEPYLVGKAVCAPAYWHQNHVLCSGVVREWIKRGFKACFLISGSVDGEVPERIARAYGAERAWYLDRWDDFMIPKPFTRVVLAVGEPYTIPRDTRLDDLEPHRLNIQQAVMSLMGECKDRLQAD